MTNEELDDYLEKNLHSHEDEYCDNNDRSVYISEVKSVIKSLFKNLPNELKGVSNNEQKEKVCCICKATKFRDANIICNKCKDEHR